MRNDITNEISPSQPSADEEDKDYEAPIPDVLEQIWDVQINMRNTNFRNAQFIRLCELISDNLQNRLRDGKGKRYKLAPLNMLFITLAYLKRRVTCNDTVFAFLLKNYILKNNVSTMITHYSKHQWSSSVRYSKVSHNKKLYDDNTLFSNFTSAKYATGVRIQQSVRLCGTCSYLKQSFSVKHDLYSLKREVLVLSNDLYCRISPHAICSISDIKILRCRTSWHKAMLQTSCAKLDIFDHDDHQAEYPNTCSVLMDKGYQGVQIEIRVFHLIRQSPG